METSTILTKEHLDECLRNQLVDIKSIMSTAPQPDKWLTKKAYSEKYQISLGSIRNGAIRGDIKTKHIGRRVYVLDQD